MTGGPEAADDRLGPDGAVNYEGLFGALLRHSYDAVVLNTISTRRMLEVSDSFCALTGYERHELVGRTSVELGLVEAGGVRAEVEAAADRGDEGLYDTVLHRKDGTRRRVEFSHQLLGTDDLVISIVRDVTERRELEQRLRAHGEEADRVRADAEAARAEADRANRAKTEFLSRVSHELRTPLNSILGYAQLLELEVLTPAQRDSVEQIRQGGDHLLDLIRELLDIARIESGDLVLSIEPVRVEALLEEAFAVVRPLASRRSIELAAEHVAGAGFVLADHQRLRQILLNLLSNAIKYNQAEGSVTVTCEQIGFDRLRIHVTDTGAGIEPDKVDRLFTPFDRLGAEHSGIEGTGLGLAVSHRLATAMGAALLVDSVVGSGTTFSVDLVLTAAPADGGTAVGGGAADTPAAAVTAPRHLVLCIDDNPTNRRLVDQVLASQRPDIEALFAADGETGLRSARRRRPDLVILDNRLPDTTGLALLGALAADPTTAEVPVVILSADATPGTIQQLLHAGAVAYLTKPLDLHEFVTVLDHHLARVT